MWFTRKREREKKKKIRYSNK